MPILKAADLLPQLGSFVTYSKPAIRLRLMKTTWRLGSILTSLKLGEYSDDYRSLQATYYYMLPCRQVCSTGQCSNVDEAAHKISNDLLREDQVKQLKY